MNSAPTAEEQLPPLKIVCRNGVDDTSYMCLQVGNELLAEVFQGRVKRLQGLLDQLLAALRENREKDAELNILRECETHRKELIAQLAEKDAYLSERNKRMHGKFGFMADPDGSDKCACAYCTRDVEALADHAAEMECELFLPSGLKARAESAEAKLRAVSDALGEEMQHWTPQGAEWAYYVKSEVDARDARIRAILEGK